MNMYRDDPQDGPGIPLPWATQTPILTYALVAVNVFVWLVMTTAGGSTDEDVLLDFGAMFGPLIADGQYWRLFTAMFLHVGLMHLGFNGLALLIFGRLVERVYGHYRFITIYVLAGLAGGVTSYLLNSIAIAAGASGAIFGILGALAAFFVAERNILGEMGRQNLYAIFILTGINLVFGLMVPNIDNWAHMGGLAGGFSLGLLLAPRYRFTASAFGLRVLRERNLPSRRLWVIPAALALLGLGTWLGTATVPDNPLSRLYAAERAFVQEDYDLALEEIDRAIEVGPPNGAVHYLRARILADLGDIAGASDELVLAIQLGDRETQSKAVELLVALRARR